MPKLDELLHEIRRIEEHRQVLTDKKIKAMYTQLMDDLYKYLGKNYAKYADKDGRLYMSYLDAQNKRAKFLQEIVKNVDNISPELKKEMTALVNKTYNETYKGMVEAVKKSADGKAFEELVKDIEVNPDVMKRAMKNNISKLTLPAVMEKHRQEIIYQIQQELNIGLMRGDRYDTMTKRIAERVGVSETKAKNIVRTESHRNVEDGFMDCAKEISSGLDGSDLIYAVTWRTMKDERVRPQQRRKTKKGWKTTISRNGANHQKMEGVTIKVGEKFELEKGVEAENPGNSGVARHDCNCRCFLEYNLMTIEEFAKATHQTPEQVRKKYEMDNGENAQNEGEPIMVDTIDFSDEKIVIEKLNEAEKEFVDLPYEMSRTITSDGKVWDTKGIDGYVWTDKIETQPNGSSLKGSYSYHNHPKKVTHYSFSGDDVGSFLGNEEAFAKASDNRYEYTMKRTTKTLWADRRDIESEFDEIYQKDIYQMSFDELIDIDEDGYHEVMKILSKKYGFVYNREKKR